MSHAFHRITAAFVLFASAARLGAQRATPAGSGAIHGRVVTSSSSTPVVGATVEVRGIADTTMTVAGRVITGPTGAFRLDHLAFGRYRLQVRMLGFAPVTLPSVVVSSTTRDVDIGVVTLNQSAVVLESVQANARNQDVELAPDRNTFVVGDMPTTRGGSAIDVLRAVPSVDVDIDNVVSLRANTGVVIQINGRTSPMKPAQLGNFLAQLPASMVDKVEVIPNPSARDNPEGSAGIINIVLRKTADPGLSGGLTGAGGTTGRVDAGGNTGYQRGPITLFGSYGFSRDHRPQTESIFRENRYATPVTYLREEGLRDQFRRSHTVTGSGVLRMTSRDELGTDILFSTRADSETRGLFYRNLDNAQQLAGSSSRLSHGTNEEMNLESALNYKHTFAKGHQLTSELRYSRAKEGGPAAFTTGALAPDGTPLGQAGRESSTGWDRPSDGSFKIDYNRPLAAHIRMSTGYKGSVQHFHTTLDTYVLDTTRAVFAQDASRTSDFNYDQNVEAGYGMLSGQAGKFQLQAGLRAEHAWTRFHLNRTVVDGLSTYRNAYNSVFPSGLVAYAVDDARQVKLSYSTRIRRPDDTDVIDPTLHYQDPLNLSRGNPSLQPEYVRAIELGLQQSTDRATVQLTPFYRHTLDAVRRIRTIDSLGVTTTTYANVATTDAYGADATLALNQGSLTGVMSASAFGQQSNAANLDPSLSTRTFGWTVRGNVTYRASRSIDMQALVSYRPATTIEQGQNLSQTRINFAARKKLMADRLNVTIRAIDPFSTERQGTITSDSRVYQLSARTVRQRGLLLNVAWNFGASKRGEGDDLGAGVP